MMKKLVLAGLVAAISLSWPTIAAAQEAHLAPAVVTTDTTSVDLDGSSEPALMDSAGTFDFSQGMRNVHWYVANNGYTYSNICQTPGFWVAFRRYYLVGNSCVASLNGIVDYGWMVQR